MKDEFYQKCQEITRISKESEDFKVLFVLLRHNYSKTKDRWLNKEMTERNQKKNFVKSGKSYRVKNSVKVLNKERGDLTLKI